MNSLSRNRLKILSLDLIGGEQEIIRIKTFEERTCFVNTQIILIRNRKVMYPVSTLILTLHSFDINSSDLY